LLQFLYLVKGFTAIIKLLLIKNILTAVAYN